MRVLVLGSGGREHTLVWKIAQSPLVNQVYAMPGNAGMKGTAKLVDGDPQNPEEATAVAQDIDASLVVVGPEAPLAEGVTNELRKKHIPVFGPTRSAARIESSKVFAKNLMSKYDIPTADYRVFDDPDAASEHLRQRNLPAVVKADGLAAGKGAIPVDTLSEAEEAIDVLMRQRRFGEAGDRVIVEDFLRGEEVSLLAFTDGKKVIPLIAAQDYKAAYDGGQGPNTGGMGARSPVPFFDEQLASRTMQEILRPTVDALRQEGCPFSGVLYAGLMITDSGPEVLEFNCRFGDPEAQVILPRMQSDLVELLAAVAREDGDLSFAAENLRWREEAAVCVVAASGGYPVDYEKGKPITGLPANDGEDVVVFHAGTSQRQGQWVTDGGRVLGVCGLGSTLDNAREKAYEGIEKIEFEGKHYRTDIGK